jgi:hypothetical protein
MDARLVVVADSDEDVVCYVLDWIWMTQCEPADLSFGQMEQLTDFADLIQVQDPDDGTFFLMSAATLDALSGLVPELFEERGAQLFDLDDYPELLAECTALVTRHRRRH